MPAIVQLGYRGISLGTAVTMERFTEDSAFLVMDSPMPVGSKLVVSEGDMEMPVVVRRVVETAPSEGTSVGMLVGPEELGDEAQEWWRLHAEADIGSLAAASESKEQDNAPDGVEDSQGEESESL